MSNHLDYEINKELGECYLFMGELDKAEDYYTKAAGSNGIHPDPYLGLATIAVQRGDMVNALELYKKAAGIEPNDKSLAGMALVEIETGRVLESFDHFAKALEYNPENLVALFGLVRAGHMTERLSEVVPHLENYLVMYPDKHEVRYSLAGCLTCMGQNAAAKSHLEEILKMDPAQAPAQELLAQVA